MNVMDVVKPEASRRIPKDFRSSADNKLMKLVVKPRIMYRPFYDGFVQKRQYIHATIAFLVYFALACLGVCTIGSLIETGSVWAGIPAALVPIAMSAMFSPLISIPIEEQNWLITQPPVERLVRKVNKQLESNYDFESAIRLAAENGMSIKALNKYTGEYYTSKKQLADLQAEVDLLRKENPTSYDNAVSVLRSKIATSLQALRTHKKEIAAPKAKRKIQQKTEASQKNKLLVQQLDREHARLQAEHETELALAQAARDTERALQERN